MGPLLGCVALPAALLWCGAGGAAGGSQPCKVLYWGGGGGAQGAWAAPSWGWCHPCSCLLPRPLPPTVPCHGHRRTEPPWEIKVYRRAVPSGGCGLEPAGGWGAVPSGCGAGQGYAVGVWGGRCRGQGQGGLGVMLGRVGRLVAVVPGRCHSPAAAQVGATGTVAVSPHSTHAPSSAAPCLPHPWPGDCTTEPGPPMPTPAHPTVPGHSQCQQCWWCHPRGGEAPGRDYQN